MSRTVLFADCDPELHERAMQAAESERRSFANFIRNAVDEAATSAGYPGKKKDQKALAQRKRRG